MINHLASREIHFSKVCCLAAQIYFGIIPASWATAFFNYANAYLKSHIPSEDFCILTKIESDLGRGHKISLRGSDKATTIERIFNCLIEVLKSSGCNSIDQVQSLSFYIIKQNEEGKSSISISSDYIHIAEEKNSLIASSTDCGETFSCDLKKFLIKTLDKKYFF